MTVLSALIGALAGLLLIRLLVSHLARLADERELERRGKELERQQRAEEARFWTGRSYPRKEMHWW